MQWCHAHLVFESFRFVCSQNCVRQIYLSEFCLGLFWTVFTSHSEIANGFLRGKVRSAETFHGRKYHQCIWKRNEMTREKSTRMRASNTRL